MKESLVYLFLIFCANDEAVCILLQMCRELVSWIFRLPQISAAPPGVGPDVPNLLFRVQIHQYNLVKNRQRLEKGMSSLCANFILLAPNSQKKPRIVRLLSGGKDDVLMPKKVQCWCWRSYELYSQFWVRNNRSVLLGEVQSNFPSLKMNL